MELHLFYIGVAVAASVLFPGTLLFIRTRVRQNRQRLILELGSIFHLDTQTSQPAFDYVRAKYELPTHVDDSQLTGTALRTSTFSLIGAAIPYVVMCAFGFVLLFYPMRKLVGPDPSYIKILSNFFWTLGGTPRLQEAVAVLCAAFLGSYIVTGRALLRSVQNYELNQLRFVEAAAHMGFGMVLSIVLYHLVRNAPFAETCAVALNARQCTNEINLSALLLLGFVCGYYPDFGLLNVTRRIKITFMKERDFALIGTAKSIPLQILDGIDLDIQNRLENAGFFDVQNLAVANPLLIYVETPYSLYQAFDWVLQAQLCLAVDGQTFFALKQHRIRTSLDLERAILSDDSPDSFVLSVGKVVFRNQISEGKPLPEQPIDWVKHGVMVMLDDLHVHRIRALWNHVFKQVSGTSGRHWIYRWENSLSKPAPEVGTSETDPNPNKSDEKGGDV
jgi:hypothetical protein